MRVLWIVILGLTLSTLNTSCSKNSPADSKPPQPQADTNWVTQPQINIPWPGLANSAWPMFMHDPQHTGRSPYPGPQLGQVEWVFDASVAVYSSPVIDEDGTIYFSGLNSNFFAVSSNGTLKWKGSGSADNHPLITSDGTILILGNHILYCYDRSGSLRWQHDVGQQPILGSGAISKDGQTMYICSGFGVSAFRKDGSLLWRTNPDTAQNTYRSVTVSQDGITLYVAAENAIFAIDSSGALKWKSVQPGTTDILLDNSGNLYFGTGGNAVLSLTQSGNTRWRLAGISYRAYASPAMAKDGTVYFTGYGLYAIDYSGKLKWKFPFATMPSVSPPVVDAEGTIYVGRATSHEPADSINFYAVNSNGTLRWQLSLREQDGKATDIDSPPTISSDGKIYVGSDYPHSTYVFKIK